MTFSKPVTLGCLAILAIAVSLQVWSAPRLYQPIEQPLGSIAPIVLSNADLRDGTSKGYRPWFENGAWQGDLIEYTVTKDGYLSTSDRGTWSALVQFSKKNTTYWRDGRKIISWNGSSQVPFRFTNNAIGATNKALLDPAAENGASAILDYIRGDQTNEYPNGAQLRKRSSILGDIIHSKPVYVGAPNDNRTENDYAAWAAGKIGREPRVYVGANDGMLHVFDAATGNEVYAYIPSMLMGKLNTLTKIPYKHRYFVDGEMSVRDAYFDKDWHTLLVGSLGAGGKGFFGLDITNPDLDKESVNTGNNKKVLFEFNASADTDLGDSFSRPVIAKLNDGDWYVVIGNGYNSVNGVAMLYLVNLETLTLTKISTSSGSAGNPNGLSSPSLLDTDNNGTADYAYAGDIDGNLWKFDLSADNTGAWEVAYNVNPLHPTAGDQSIIQAPQIARHPQHGYMLYFATGRLLTAADISDTSVQSLYGIWDSGNQPPTASNQSLLTQIWDGPKTYHYTISEGSTAAQTIAIYNTDAGEPDWQTRDGWKVDFPAGGYRVLQPVQVRANRVKATVYKPSNIAGQQGENWLIEALLADGGPNTPAAPIYDLNVDGLLNILDLYNDTADVGTAEFHVPMMWRRANGIMSQVTIGYLGIGKDALFINYLQPQIVSDIPCKGPGQCEKGFLGGHIDLQTYQGDVALDGVATADTHAYDSLTKLVYVDFFKLFLPESETTLCQLYKEGSVLDQVEIDSNTDTVCGYPTNSSGISGDEEFIVLVANADLSPGSTMRIGNRTWDVVEYQKQIENALRDWDPTEDGNPVDSDGIPLVFTWSGINAAKGNISHNFDDRALIDGGIHPTQPGCVSGRAQDTPITGRWRNGALTTQLVKKSYFEQNRISSAIDMVTVQRTGESGPVTGILAKNRKERIWESTLFWDFGDLTEAAGLGRPCYGSPGWDDAKAFALSNNPISAALAKRGYDLDSDTLAAAVAALQSCKNTSEAEGGCKARWTLLNSILDLSDDYTRKPVSGFLQWPTAPDGQTPFPVGGTVDGTITEGPSYIPGRESWTDVVK